MRGSISHPPAVLAALTLAAGLATSLSAQAPQPAPTILSEPLPDAAPTPAPSAAIPAAAPDQADSAALEQQAEQKYAQGDLEAAAQLYGQAAESNPATGERVRLLVAAASIENELGHKDHAVEAMTRALVLQPDYVLTAGSFAPSLQDVYYEGKRRAVEQRAVQAHERAQEGDAKARANDWAAARQAFAAALALDANLPAAIFGLAQVDAHDGKAEPAIAGFQRLLALRRSSPTAVPPELQFSALNNLGILYYQRGFLEDAESALAEAVQLEPNQPSAWSNLGLVRRKLGRRDEASAAFLKARDLDPNDDTTISNLALSYIDAANWVEAVALLSEATKRTPAGALLWLNLGIAQHGMGNQDGALDSFAKAEGLDPRDAQGVAHRAAAYLSLLHFQQNKFTEAAADARRLLDLQPQDVDGWVDLGQAQLATGDVPSARDSFEKAFGLDPARPEISNNLGSAYYRLGDFEKSADAFQRALAMRKDYLAAQDNLALAKRRLAELEALDRRLGLVVDSTAGQPAGVHVAQVKPQSAAARAELQPGDVIVRVEGTAVASAAELHGFLDVQPPPRSLSIELLRQGKLAKAKLRLQ